MAVARVRGVRARTALSRSPDRRRSDRCRARPAPPKPNPAWSLRAMRSKRWRCRNATAARLAPRPRWSATGGRSAACSTAPHRAPGSNARRRRCPTKLRSSRSSAAPRRPGERSRPGLRRRAIAASAPRLVRPARSPGSAAATIRFFFAESPSSAKLSTGFLGARKKALDESAAGPIHQNVLGNFGSRAWEPRRVKPAGFTLSGPPKSSGQAASGTFSTFSASFAWVATGCGEASAATLPRSGNSRRDASTTAPSAK